MLGSQTLGAGRARRDARALKTHVGLAKWLAIALLACGPAWATGSNGPDGTNPGDAGTNGGTDQTVNASPATLQGIGGNGGNGADGANAVASGDQGGTGGAGGTGGEGSTVSVGGNFTNAGVTGGNGGAGGQGGPGGGTTGPGGDGGTGGAGGSGVSFGATGVTFTNPVAALGGIGGAGGAGGGSFGQGGNAGSGGIGGTGIVFGTAGSTITISGTGSALGGLGGAGGNASTGASAAGTGGSGGIGIGGVGVTINNQGTIAGGAGGTGGAEGPLGNGGSGGSGGDAISGSDLTIVNSGTITAGAGGAGAPGSSRPGADGATGNAITFTGGANTLTLQAGSTITGNIAVTGSLTFNQSTAQTLNNVITGSGSVIQAGTATLTLGGTNTYGGGTSVTSGLVNFSAANNFGSGTITLNGGGLQWATGTSTDISGRLAAIGAGGATFDTNGNNVTFASALTGVTSDGGIVKAGAGTLTLTGANTYTGATTINAGTLAIGRTDALATTGALAVNGGTFDLNGFNQTIGSLTGSGTVTNGDSVAATLTVSNSSPSAFSGVIQDGTHATALRKTGSDTLTLSGNNTYSGGTTLSQGTLAVGSNTALGSGTVTTSSGTTLQAATAVSLANAFTLNATLTVDTGANAMTLSGVIDGLGALTKSGSGTLTLSGNNSYHGTTIVGFGTLLVNGSISSNTAVTAQSTLGGGGTINGSVNVTGGTIAPGNSIGTLTIVGGYSQDANSTYQVEVNNSGLSDKLVITGTAALAGTLAVQAQPGKYQRTSTYTILTASGGITGNFSTLTSSMASLTPTVVVAGNTVTLIVLNSAAILPGSDTNSFTANQSAIANVLNQAGTTITGGDLNAVLNTLSNLTPAQLAPILDSLSGQNYSGFSSIAMQGSQVFMNSFQVQAGGGAGGGASLPGGSTWQALKVGPADACDTACDVEPLWGAWGGGMGAFGTVAGDSNSHGLTYNLGGFIAGLDRKFAPGFRAGVAAGFNAATLYTQGMPGTGTSNTLQFALYGEYAPGPFYLDALAGYGHSDNRMNRPIIIPGLPFRMAQGYTTANTFFGQLETGYKVVVAPNFGGFVTPFARLQASTSTQAGFSETGADSLNLTIAQQTTNSLRTVLGAQLGAGIDALWHEKLDLVFRLGWSHEFADQTRPVTAAFAGAPALSFTTFGASAPRDGVVLGLGANTQVAGHTSVYFRYDGDLAGANTNHVLNAGVRYVW